MHTKNLIRKIFSILFILIYTLFDKVTDALYYYFYLGGTIITLLVSLFFLNYHTSSFYIWLTCHFIMVSSLSISYHRYFAHKTFRANRVIQFFIGLYGVLCFQKGPLWWTSIHRMHHHFCGTDQDPHTTNKGFYYSHFAWTRDPQYTKIRWEYIPDLIKFKELLILEYLYLIIIPLLSVFMYSWGGLVFLFSFHVAITTSVNCIAFLNSICHIKKQSRCLALNIYWLALLTLGEGLHQNHHQNPKSAKVGIKWFEFDPIYLVIHLLKRLHVVR